MTIERDTTHQLREICQALVRDHLEHERTLFDDTWRAFWQTVGHTSLEDLSDSLEWEPTADRPVVQLGAIGDQQSQVLDTL